MRWKDPRRNLAIQFWNHWLGCLKSVDFGMSYSGETCWIMNIPSWELHTLTEVGALKGVLSSKSTVQSKQMNGIFATCLGGPGNEIRKRPSYWQEKGQMAFNANLPCRLYGDWPLQPSFYVVRRPLSETSYRHQQVITTGHNDLYWIFCLYSSIDDRHLISVTSAFRGWKSNI